MQSIGAVTFVAPFSETGWTTIIRGYCRAVDGRKAVVELYLDDIAIRSQRAEQSFSESDEGNQFEFYVSERLVNRLPKNAKITVKIAGSDQLLPVMDGIQASINGASDDDGAKLRKMLAGQYHIDHWGDLHRAFGKVPGLKQEFVEFYAQWRDFFLKEENAKIFLIGGNLLGIVREGDFLDHDDDLDVAIGLIADTPADAAAAFFAFYDRVSPKIRELGYRVVLMAPGHMQILHTHLVLDIFASWLTSDGKYYRMIGTGGDYGATEHNCQSMEFRGTEVFLPEFPERELELSYGAGWISPDPHFVWNIPKDVLQTMREFKKAGWNMFKERIK